MEHAQLRLFLFHMLLVLFISPEPSGLRGQDAHGTATAGDVAKLETGQIQCTIGTNTSHQLDGVSHRAGYNGIYQLTSVHQAESPFVSAFAGLNLEHYFDGRPKSSAEVFFEPRYAKMTLERLGPKVVQLYQPTTPTFQVESWTRFEIRDPYYVDFSFTCVPHRENFEGDFLGVFWASYINEPADKSIYFLDGQSDLEHPFWRQFCTQQHDRDSSVRGATDKVHLAFQRPGEALFSSISPLRYSAPFFYGRFRNMVLIYIFQPPNGLLRFAHSPSGGGTNRQGDDTCPAWDVQLILPEVTMKTEYELNGRLVYKPWKDRADVLSEVRRYLVASAAAPPADDSEGSN